MAAGSYSVYLNLNDYESIIEVSTVLSFSTSGVAPLTIYDDVYFTPGSGTYDALAGGIGADTFEFSVGHGNNRIEDFEDGVGLIHINANTSTQGTLIVANHADGALITFANVTIIVEDMHYTDITLADITF